MKITNVTKGALVLPIEGGHEIAPGATAEIGVSAWRQCLAYEVVRAWVGEGRFTIEDEFLGEVVDDTGLVVDAKPEQLDLEEAIAEIEAPKKRRRRKAEADAV